MRFTQEANIQLFGDRSVAVQYIGLARKLLGDLTAYNHDLSPITREGITSRTHKTPDGALIQVIWFPWQPVIKIFPPAEPARQVRRPVRDVDLIYPCGATAIVDGFNSSVLPPNDDLSTELVNIGFTLNFYGELFDQLYVNNNGNVTFDNALFDYIPFELVDTAQQIIAPHFSDVDTRYAGDPVTYGTGEFAGRPTFGVNWINVDYYFSSPQNTNRNSYQLLLVDRSDIAANSFDIIFNYTQIQWEAGTASGSDNEGLGGTAARAGYSNGTGLPGTSYELPGSGVNGAFLDGGPNALASNSHNSPCIGRYVYYGSLRQ